MTRQRQVFPRDTVAHLWAHGAQDSARDAGHSFYFTGGTLYSYGAHFVIAHILRGDEYGALNGRVLWNDASYSNTTAKHKNRAWRAMTQQQRQTALDFPSLNSDDARQIDRAIRDKRLPDVAAGLLRRVQSDVASIIGKRHGSGPFCHALYNARKYDATARALYAAAGRKYPLADIPANDDIPADKAERAAFVAAFSRAIVQDDYSKALESARLYLNTCHNADTSADGAQYVDPRTATRIYAGTYDAAERGLRACDDADKHYWTLHAGKASPQAGKIRKALQPLADAFKAKRDEATRVETLARLEHFASRYYLGMHKARHSGKRQAPACILRALPGYISQVKQDATLADIPADSIVGRAVARVSRIDDAIVINKAAENARQSFKTAESYGEQWPADAMRCYSEVSNYARQIRIRESRYSAYMLQGLAPILGEAASRADAMRSVIQAREAAKIAGWISGASNVRPNYSAGTYARINGGFVETTQGASVPIEHACRLARVYDRIVNVGGMSWVDGTGPMVGHYRVNHIGADGALVIGCHNFSPDEARRLRDVMAQCDECKAVKAGA